MATHSSILAWKIPQTEEPGELQSKGSQKSHMTEHMCARARAHTHTHTHTQHFRERCSETKFSGICQ